MKENEELPEQVRCFICMKVVPSEDTGIFVIRSISDTPKSVGVLLCSEDFDWAEKNIDSAHALVKSRILGIAKRETESDNDRLGDYDA